MNTTEELAVTTAELARQLKISTRTLERWRENGGGPPFILAGRTVRYPIRALHSWLRETASS